MLRDSAHIQEFEAEWRNRKAMRKGGEPYVPLYTMKEALGALELFVPHPYGERFTLTSGIDVRFLDAGHLLGSSSIEIWLTGERYFQKLVFSGDIGNLNQPLIRDRSRRKMQTMWSWNPPTGTGCTKSQRDIFQAWYRC